MQTEPKQNSKASTQAFFTAINAECTEALRSHSGVREAVACRIVAQGHQDIVAFVVADDSYMDQVLQRAAAEKNQTRVWRKTYDLSQFAKSAVAAPLAFNTLGWNSSYTRQPIPEEDMREWVQTTVERISTLAPRNVLEIGCGTGMLLLRIAPTCARYVGMDFSTAVLASLREQLAQVEGLADKIEILERPADNLDGFAENSFDTVIINSVAQHFPNLAYLNRVMEAAIDVVRPGGSIFVGDQRSLPLLGTYALSVEAVGAASDTTVAELRDRVQRRVQQEQQLVLSPSFFLSVGRRHPKVSSVQIYLRRGKHDNEMTRFRYDAVLRIGSKSASTRQIRFFDPPQGGWTLDDIRTKLTTDRSSGIGIAGIGNFRVAKHVRLLQNLAAADPEKPFAKLGEGVDRCNDREIHPEAIAQLATETGYEVSLSWASCRSDGSYDAAFVRGGGPERGVFPTIDWPQPAPKDFVHFGNAPAQDGMRGKLADSLIAECRSLLPDQLVPAKVYVVDSLPTKDDGTVDCNALLVAVEESACRPIEVEVPRLAS